MSRPPAIRILAVAVSVGLLAAGCVAGSPPAAEPDGGAGEPGDVSGHGREDGGSGADAGCIDGSMKVCGNGKGTCQKGTQTCEQGVWGECEGETGPSEETCDGRDNDCDGDVDELEKCACQPGETRSCGQSTGVCETGTRACRSGRWGPCTGQTESSAEMCDGRDNDCDGSTDEGLTESCGKSTGACEPGTRTCQQGSFGPCEGEIGPEPDGPPNCNGVDDDCDGQVDEGNCKCTDGDTRPCGKATGECTKGKQTCQGGTWGKCVGSTGPTPETCDSRDNDCDTRIDEGLTRKCGTSTGVCSRGTQTCNRGKWGSCNGGRRPGNETCDRKDNDCDGTVNNGIDCTFFATEKSEVYRIDPFDKSLAKVQSTSPPSEPFFDLDTHPNGRLFSIAGSTLYSRSPATKKWVAMGDTQIQSNTLNGLAISASNEGFITADNRLFRADLSSGSATKVADLGKWTSSGDCVIDEKGVLFMSAEGSNDDILVQIDKFTGQVRKVGEMDHEKVWGLMAAWGALWGTTSAGDVIRIDRTTGDSQRIHSFPNKTWYGAASTPASRRNP